MRVGRIGKEGSGEVSIFVGFGVAVWARKDGKGGSSIGGDGGGMFGVVGDADRGDRKVGDAGSGGEGGRRVSSAVGFGVAG